MATHWPSPGPGPAGEAPAPEPMVWRRADGRVRVMVHMDGRPEAAEPEEVTPLERACDWLDLRIPGWDGYVLPLVLGVVVLLIGALAALL